MTQGGAPGGTIPVKVDKTAGEVQIDAGGITAGGGKTIVTVPPIPNVDTYKVSIPVPDLKAPGRPGALTVNTEAGSVTVPSNMLTGVRGTDGQKAEIVLGQGDKSALPPGIQNKIGDRPLIQLSLLIDGKQTDWRNNKAPVTLSIPYTPTPQELRNPRGHRSLVHRRRRQGGQCPERKI